jgi:arginyl-tRNA synthetase
MKPVIEILEERISAAMMRATGGQKAPAIVRPTTDPKFGDYQANGVMALAKKVQIDPRQLAELIIKTLDINDICEKPEIAGPGFINLRLKPGFVAANLLQINKDADRLGIEKTLRPQTVVADFSGPNIAKQMHVGHLRSTIIGDCICRLLEFEGYKVIRQNHIGDWGTQFGMLIQQVFEGRMAAASEGVGIGKPYSEGNFLVSDTEELYRKAKMRDDSEPQFAQKAREWVVKLQNGYTDAVAFWGSIVRASLAECQEMYDKVGVKLTKDNVRGESFYKDMLPDVVAELKKKKLAVESDGAICVFPPGFKDKDGKPLPVIIQKSDGAYLYATTDLAAIRYRVNELKADKIIYITDSRQQLHFQMVFAVAKMAGWDVKQMTEDGRQKTEDRGRKTEFVHVTFGSVLGEDGKPLKTREGENVKLKELLNEAVERAKAIVEEKNPDLPEEQKDRIAKAVGIGAVKYADYSNNRTSDYVFSFDKMLAMDGNTAPYMQYAYARVQSIKDKGKEREIEADKEITGLQVISLTESSELDLAKHLIRYNEAIEAATADYRPNYLTSYLYELAQKFSVFYTNCPVLGADPNIRPTRLLLCDLTARTIKHGLSELLGIEVVEQM